MSSEVLRAWLALISMPGLRHSTALRLLEQHSTPEALLSVPLKEWGLKSEPPELSVALYDWQRRKSASAIMRSVECQLRQLEGSDDQLLCWSDEEYPAYLREIADPPLVLFVRGRVELLSSPQLGVVGSRKASSAGKRTAFELSAHAAAMGVTITSGLARGIDSAAHRGALSVEGNSVAVVATGLDICYPAQHRDLAEELLVQGTIVSECAYGSPPRRQAFPRRNRIISGLSKGVLVVEAALPSGSLITARLAADQGREVFAVPGSIYNYGSRGCHYLLRDGAVLVESVADIAREFDWLKFDPPDNPEGDSVLDDLSWLERSVLSLVGYEVSLLDEISGELSLPVNELLSALAKLEAQGFLEQRAGGYQRC